MARRSTPRWKADVFRPTTDGRYGVYVMLAADLEEAALAATDPHHQRGIRAWKSWVARPSCFSFG
jgi:hypothetical protein